MNIPEYYMYEAERVDNGEVVLGYYIFYKHMGEEKHIIATDWAQIYVNSYYVKPETVRRVAAKPTETIFVEKWECPVCRSALRTNTYCRQFRFCHGCGMALDWE